MATNVRLMRQDRQMTQEDLADLTGISSRYVGSIERGRVSASVTILGKLAEALGVSACSLITQPKKT